MANEIGVEVPIVEALYRVVYEGAIPSEQIGILMDRPIKKEGK